VSSASTVAAVAPTVVRSLQSLQLESLRALLPAPLPQAPGMPTGIDVLDRALASNGLPRGRLTEVVGATPTTAAVLAELTQMRGCKVQSRTEETPKT